MALAPVKRALIGPPLPTARLVHERLNKIQGLAVFSSDNLSSSAYATEEILLALTAAGVGAVSLAWPVALAITAVFAIVGFSYYQTIHAYPSGGGAYIVARSNLGVWPGLTAAAALLIDYILTVSVSVAAGIAAITSAVPALFPQRVAMSLAAVGIIVLVNLRGVRESGTVFSIPTYFFVAMMFTMLGLGLFKSLGSPPIPPTLPVGSAEALQPLTLLLILRAFASGSA
ncbi:MAG TPA: amino acid permease, partial [bacterium]|nr:amino acid permease [bacterium]